MKRKEPLAEVVYFVDEDDGIIREMMYADFEALVDGLIAMPEFAGAMQRAVYARINQQFRIVACVLFRIPFDDEGHVVAQWHLPVEQLCGSSGKGPNLGAGPVKLSCSVQCSVPWHQSKLWDPQEVGDLFYWLKDAAKENQLGIDFDALNDDVLDEHDVYGNGDDYSQGYDEDLDGPGGTILENQESPFLRDEPQGPYPGPSGHDMPYRGYPPQHQHHQMVPPMAYGYDPSQLPPGYYPSVMPGQMPGHMPGQHPHQHHGQQVNAQQAMAAELSKLQTQFQKKEQLLQQKLKQLAQKHKQEMQQNKSRYESRLLNISKEYEQSMEEVSGELSRLRMKIENLLSQKDSLEDICAAQKAQIKGLTEKLEDLRQRSEEKQRENTEALSRKYELNFEIKMRELEREYDEKLREKDAEIVYRQEVVKQLRKDITNMRRDKIRLVNSGGDKFLEKLDELGISFIAFHAGAGHISIPLTDMSAYMENPVAYAASRCLVSEEVYRAWLEHHENPVCQYVTQKDSNTTCGCKVRKAEVPSDFQAGITNRCEKHKSLTSDWENVVNIGT